MSHDLDDLLFLIKQLEERIINLEVSLINLKATPNYEASDDSYYWNHG